jgi:hypothetical protein
MVAWAHTNPMSYRYDSRAALPPYPTSVSTGNTSITTCRTCPHRDMTREPVVVLHIVEYGTENSAELEHTQGSNLNR